MVSLFTADFTLDRLESEIRALAKASPHTTYGESEGSAGQRVCAYSRGECSNGSVGCIVGQGLARCGVDVVALDALYPDGKGIEGVFEDAGIDGYAGWIGLVQEAQDEGMEWAMAVKSANEGCND